MADKIEIYVRKEEVVTGEAVYETFSEASSAISGPTDGMVPTRTVARGVKTEKVMPEADRTAVEVVKRFADERGLQVEICSVSTFIGRLKARQKGVKTTPTIVIGKFRIEGELAPELLRNRLELALKK
jgi:hypothetical protein